MGQHLCLRVSGTGNKSIRVTDQGVLSAWNTTANRDVRIRGIYFDGNSTSNIDNITWTEVYVMVEAENQTGYFTTEWADTENVGYYNVTDLWANDTFGNSKQNQYTDVYFHVNDTTPPVFSSPAVNDTLLGNGTRKVQHTDI